MADIEHAIVVSDTILHDGTHIRYENLFGSPVYYQDRGSWYVILPQSPFRRQPTEPAPIKIENVRYVVSFEVANRYSHRTDLFIPKCYNLHGSYYTGLTTFNNEIESESEEEEFSSSGSE